MNPQRKHAIIAASVFVGLLAAAFVIPAAGPENLQSLRVDMTATRTLTGKYEVRLVDTTAKPMTVLVWDAIWHNQGPEKLGFLRTGSHTATLTLEANGRTLAHHEAGVGDFPLLGSGERSFTTVFLDIPPGAYTLHVLLHDADGASRATLSTPLQLHAR